MRSLEEDTFVSEETVITSLHFPPNGGDDMMVKFFVRSPAIY